MSDTTKDTTPEFEPSKVSNIFDPPKRAPKDSTPSQPGTKRQGRTSAHDRRKAKLMGILGTVGTAVLMFEQHDGTHIITNAENFAEATATLADEVPSVAKALDAMSTGGAWGGFFLALASMVIPILAHHKIIPAFMQLAVIPNDPSGLISNNGFQNAG